MVGQQAPRNTERRRELAERSVSGEELIQDRQAKRITGRGEPTSPSVPALTRILGLSRGSRHGDITTRSGRSLNEH